MRATRRRRPRAGRALLVAADQRPDADLRWALGDWLLYRRIAGRELARRVGLGRTTVQRLASGRARRVDLHTLAALCRALDLAPADLIVWQGQDPLPPGARGRARQLRLWR
jgi:DNA-binding Xre family transcriptional regulator